jgi:hypothetical protein
VGLVVRQNYRPANYCRQFGDRTIADPVLCVELFGPGINPSVWHPEFAGEPTGRIGLKGSNAIRLVST